MAARKPRRNANGNGKALSVADWLLAARAELIQRGVLSVKVDRLARKLHVTRGSFYWHFDSQADLLRRLLDHWMTNNTEPFKRVLTSYPDATRKFQAIVDLWLSEDEYDPRFDTAVREWARVSPQVGRVVRRVDDQRIEVLRQIFLELGYVDPDATVRARITYFHQVGYYALGIVESTTARRRLRPYYTRALMGKE
jgi:AcrR family transcriptional regulator